MMQEDTNAESSFEFIEKTKLEQQNNENKESGSSGSTQPTNTMPLVPPPPITPYQGRPIGQTGNVLSSIPPPSALPSFIAAPPVPTQSPQIFTPSVTPITSPIPTMPSAVPATASPQPSITPTPMAFPNVVPFVPPTQPSVSLDFSEQPITQPSSDHYYPTAFSPAIPPSKGAALGAVPDITTSIPLTPPIGDEVQGNGIFGWVKGAVSSGGILSKVAEKAKSSMDSMITTLDPQMREYIYSGGDLDVLVASDKEIKISPIREAFQSVFGKATITGFPAQANNTAAQPVGFQSGIQAAKERILSLQSDPVKNGYPIVAIENFLLQVDDDSWFDLGIIMLNDPLRKISLQTFTQMTPVPSAVVTLAQHETPQEYPLKSSGLAVPIGGLVASNLRVHHSEWHEALTGVSRRTMILLAAKVLAGMYKNSISQTT